MEIYCVKVNQTQLENASKLDYFPFDRVYIVPEKNRNIALSLFRYSLILEMDSVLYKALVAMNFKTKQHIPIVRPKDPKPTKVTRLPIPELKRFEDGDWLMVIPTYITRAESSKTHLAYTLSHSITAMHNLRIKLPAIMLHTPKKDIPILCALCTHVTEYYVNNCHPASAKCRRIIDLNNLPIDPSTRDMVMQSINEGGEIV